MSRHQKQLTKKQKIIIYISAAAAAVIAAISAVILIIHTVKNPPEIIFNSNSGSYTSNLSLLSDSLDIIIPKPTVIVKNENNDEDIEEIIKTVQQVESTKNNTVIVRNYAVDKSGFIKRKTKIPVEYLSQNPELPTGCEITALTTVLNFYGYDVSKAEMSDKYLDKTIDKIGNFWEVYVGNPRENGFGCYAKPIVNAANRYLATQDSAYKVVDYSGTKFEDLLKLVEADTPVIIWSTMYSEEEQNLREPFTTVQWNVDGKDIQWISPEHCMVLIGYDLDRSVAIMSDPQRGIVEYDLDTVKARYLALHSQCIVFEEIPVITGVEDGATYYTTQCVTVSNYNLASVTLNGENCGNVFLIDGNTEDTYRIVVTDLSGNTTEITVYMMPINSMLETLGDINEYTATQNERSKIAAIKASALEMDTRYSPYEETEALEIIITACDLMLEKIDAATNELERIKKVATVYQNNGITTADDEILTKLFTDIQKLLISENLTEDQMYELRIIKSKCRDWLDYITQINSDIPTDQ